MDRDGVLNHEVGYISRMDQLSLISGAAEAVKRLNDAGLPVVVVTNQAAVARGICSEDQVRAVNQALSEQLSAGGAHISRFYYCPHHPTAGIGEYLVDCQCRKPKPGMLLQAASDLGLELTECIMVGDQLSDLEAGWQAGCRTVLVDGGLDKDSRQRLASSLRQPDLVVDDLVCAVEWILESVRVG